MPISPQNYARQSGGFVRLRDSIEREWDEVNVWSVSNIRELVGYLTELANKLDPPKAENVSLTSTPEYRQQYFDSLAQRTVNGAGRHGVAMRGSLRQELGVGMEPKAARQFADHIKRLADEAELLNNTPKNWPPKAGEIWEWTNHTNEGVVIGGGTYHVLHNGLSGNALYRADGTIRGPVSAVDDPQNWRRVYPAP